MLSATAGATAGATANSQRDPAQLKRTEENRVQPQDAAPATEKWSGKAARQGEVGAQCSLEVASTKGDGVQQDYTLIAEWYRKAAEQGHAVAQYSLGVCYASGIGVEQDFTLAAEWYRKAAELGHARAQHDLGDCYNKGQGVQQDHVLAADWYHKAVEQGRASAQNRLGGCYHWGVGVQRDTTLPVERRGDAQGASALALLQKEYATLSKQTATLTEQNTALLAQNSLLRVMLRLLSEQGATHSASAAAWEREKRALESQIATLLAEQARLEQSAGRLMSDLETAGVIGLAGGVSTECPWCAEPWAVVGKRGRLQCGCSRTCFGCADRQWKTSTKRRKVAEHSFKKVMDCPYCRSLVTERPTVLRVVL